MRKEPSLVIKQLISERYKQAAAVFWAGSCLRNQGNQVSDLDLVIVFDTLTNAYREAFLYEEWPIDAFVHVRNWQAKQWRWVVRRVTVVYYAPVIILRGHLVFTRIHVIRPEQSLDFIAKLPVAKLFGVGKVTASKLAALNIKTCTDLQSYSLQELHARFGKLGRQLYYQVRGTDNRPVEPNRPRKSVSVENTFVQDITEYNQALAEINQLYSSLELRQTNAAETPIKSQFIKIKFNDFKLVTAEIQSTSLNLEQFLSLFNTLYPKQPKPIRLLGLGISSKERQTISPQLSLF